MSASEKLKALDEQRPKNEWPGEDMIFALLNALPQIVAVVEAVEELRESLPGTLMAENRLYDALAALDEALS